MRVKVGVLLDVVDDTSAMRVMTCIFQANSHS